MLNKPEEHAQAVAQEFARPKPMRRGSLSERNVCCNKAGCACLDGPDSRHGPYFSVTRVISGRTRSFWVPADQVEVVRRQVEAGREFRKRIEEYWSACEQWADAELSGTEAASTEAAEKRGSKKSLRTKLRRKSKD